jgi:hypothetical protein
MVISYRDNDSFEHRDHDYNRHRYNDAYNIVIAMYLYRYYAVM